MAKGEASLKPETLVETSSMKHPQKHLETYEFNVGKALEIGCSQSSENTKCGKCESCLLRNKILVVKDWFGKAGDQSRRRFLLGLIRQLNSVDLLQNITSMLQSILGKDVTYARGRTNPCLEGDRASVSSDRALDPNMLEKCMGETWYWFRHANYWTQSQFLMRMLMCSNSHVLHQVGIHAKTILASEKAAFVKTCGKSDYENGSIASTIYSYNSASRPDLNLVRSACSNYDKIRHDPFTQENINYDEELINSDSEEDDILTLDSDPTYAVVPLTSKSYSGISKHKDFIRSLPVHLSKYILSFLDKVTLLNALCVSKNWRVLVEEVHSEANVNHQLKEEVMLMQGGSSRGANPLYAKDIDIAVPNIHPNSWEVIRTNEDEVQTTFKSEANFATAYSGISTRNVIMEERNVYCGAYNVLVLAEKKDPHRVIHTDGSRLVATGSQDKRVRLVDSETCKEVEPHMNGHAGSIKCIALCQKKGFVLSGSYDTSIRQWSLETGKCQKIYRGITDTVNCLEIVGDRLVAGGKDGKCKVWLIGSKNCWRTFKHRHSIVAVAMDEENCITGCEAGRVKVWDLQSTKVVKRLNGHQGALTCIKFDRWHIVTGGRDGYALAWSSQGNHSRILAALRHPKEVLCLEFIYLRVITGSADGKLRIWNMVSGQCLRIIRGNSRSDPITHLIANDNRVTLSTPSNLLVFNFEPVSYDYTLADDRMPSLVHYSKFSDAPIRQRPYSYIRAQRMIQAGATNPKIIYHDGKLISGTDWIHDFTRTEQIPQSAKTLSQRSLASAKTAQSYSRSHTSMSSRTENKSSDKKDAVLRVQTAPSTYSRKQCKSKSKASQSESKSVASVGFQVGKADSEGDFEVEYEHDAQRRVSWSFQYPEIGRTRDVGLNEMKSLLRSQIRAEGNVVPPDFIYLSVNAIQNNMKPMEPEKNMEYKRREQELAVNKRLGRPSSSPARIDPRTKVDIDDMSLDRYLDEDDTEMVSETGSKSSKTSRAKSASSFGQMPLDKTVVTDFKVTQAKYKNKDSSHLSSVKTTIPKGRILRPHTAHVVRGSPPNSFQDKRVRCKSAVPVLEHPTSAGTESTSLPIGSLPTGSHSFTTTLKEVSMVPMLMHPSDLSEKLEKMKQKNRINRLGVQKSSSDQAVGKVSPYNTPFRSNVDFKLQTYQQVQKLMTDIEEEKKKQRKLEAAKADKKAKSIWLANVKENMRKGP